MHAVVETQTFLRAAEREGLSEADRWAVTFFSGPDIPVILITVYGKGRKADLTARERHDLAGLGKLIVAAFGAGPAGRHR